MNWFFNQDADLVWFSPHMHGRGKDMTFRLKYPSGESEVVLSVPHFQYMWQFGYEAAKPIHVPKGDPMEVVSHFDNSANNPLNPNPNKDVWWGEQTFEEMMGGFFAVVVDKNVDPRRILSYTGTPRGFPSDCWDRASTAVSSIMGNGMLVHKRPLVD